MSSSRGEALRRIHLSTFENLYPKVVPLCRWLAIRLNIIGSLIDFGVCGMLVYLRGGMSSELAALVFSLSLQASDAFTWIVRLGAQVSGSSTYETVGREEQLHITRLGPKS